MYDEWIARRRRDFLFGISSHVSRTVFKIIIRLSTYHQFVPLLAVAELEFVSDWLIYHQKRIEVNIQMANLVRHYFLKDIFFFRWINYFAESIISVNQ